MPPWPKPEGPDECQCQRPEHKGRGSGGAVPVMPRPAGELTSDDCAFVARFGHHSASDQVQDHAAEHCKEQDGHDDEAHPQHRCIDGQVLREPAGHPADLSVRPGTAELAAGRARLGRRGRRRGRLRGLPGLFGHMSIMKALVKSSYRGLPREIPDIRVPALRGT